MHTPVGFEMIDGKAHVTSWAAILTNPSLPYRLTHVLLSSGLTIAFLMAGLSAYRWLRNDRPPSVYTAMRTGVTLGAILIPLQILAGDMHGINTLKHQPAKIAAMEAVWETQKGAPLVLFAVPNKETKTNDFALEIPKGASLVLTHDLNGEIKGINEFEGKHPPVKPVFFGFRVMVGVGVLMLVVSWFGLWQFRKGRHPHKLFVRVLLWMAFSGWIATVAGWYVTEIGRQPYLVYGLLTTTEAASAVPSSKIGLTLAMYLGLYVTLLIAFISTLFHMARKAGQPLDALTAPNVVNYPATQGA
jgi:cytochrome d ubiquinol oxidase subunit I